MEVSTRCMLEANGSNLVPDIEDMLKTIAFIKGHKWTSMMVKVCRTFSQFKYSNNNTSLLSISKMLGVANDGKYYQCQASYYCTASSVS